MRREASGPETRARSLVGVRGRFVLWRSTAPVLRATIFSRAGTEPTQRNERRDPDNDPVKREDHVVKRGDHHLDTVKSQHYHDGNTPCNEQLSKAAAVEH